MNVGTYDAAVLYRTVVSSICLFATASFIFRLDIDRLFRLSRLVYRQIDLSVYHAVGLEVNAEKSG